MYGGAAYGGAAIARILIGIDGQPPADAVRLTAKGLRRSAGAVDLLVAATAEPKGLTVLHYGKDFGTVASVTGRPARWPAPPGSL